MITTITQDNVYKLSGMSNEVKPLTIDGTKEIANGSIFIEIDTSTVFVFDAENKEWLESSISIGELLI